MNLKKRFKVGGVAVALATLLVQTSALAAGDEQPAEQAPAQDEASQRFERGLALFDDGDFVASLAEFRRAYAVKPVYKLRYNIGSVCLELHDYACAMQELTAYLADGGDSIATERRDAVMKLVARASSRIAKVEIVSTAGAEILVDDQVVGTAPLKQPIIVNAGRRKVTSQKDGFTSKTIVVEAPGTDSLRVVVDLQPLHSAAASGVFAPTPKAPPRFTTASFVGLGVGAALLGGAVVFGAVAQSERNDIQKQRFVGPNAPDAMRGGADRADAFALTANIVGAAGIVTLGATLGITLLRPLPSSKDASPRLGLSFGPKGGGVHGTF